MDLGDINREPFNGRQREGGLQGRTISLEQPVEGSSQPIIGERRDSSLNRVELLGPGWDTVERCRFDQHAFDEELNRRSVPRRTKHALQALAHPKRR